MFSYFILALLIIILGLYSLGLKRVFGFGKFESFFSSYLLILAINSIYFLFTFLLKQHLNFYLLVYLNLFVSIFLWIRLKKISANESKSESNNDFVAFLCLLFTVILFFLSYKSFDNGLRFPIPSMTEDGAQHLKFTYNLFKSGVFEDTYYPFGFHGNGWFFLSVGKILIKNFDPLWIANIMSIYIWSIFLLINFFISVTILDLLKTKNKLPKILVVLSVFCIGNVVTVRFMEYGFFSNWLNHLFTVALLYFVLLKKKDSELYIISIIFGFFYSYTFLIPALVFFFLLLYFKTKQPPYRKYLIVSLMLSMTLLFQLYFFQGSIKYLVTVDGGYPNYSLAVFFIYTLFSFYVLIKRKEDELNTMLYFGTAILVYCLILLGIQLAFVGRLSYSFFKIFNSIILVLAIFSLSGIYLFIKDLYQKVKKNKGNEIFIIGSFILWLLLSFKLILNEMSFGDILNGQVNFFSNNKEKYNTVIYAMENFEFQNSIYIDDDYQSTRWATLAFLPIKSNVIFDFENPLKFRDYDYYVNELKKINGKTIILNPRRLLEVECEADKLISESTKNGSQIVVYPPLDLELYKRNCVNYDSANEKK